MNRTIVLVIGFLASSLLASETEKAPMLAPKVDRVGFPKGYAEKFQVLRTIIKKDEQKVVTIYGNEPAASVTNTAQLPFPYGSVIVMETASASKDALGKPILDEKGDIHKGQITGLHVMRREKDFGEAYGDNRTAEWEYVEYRADGTYITPPERSASCAACHVKAGVKRDFVYRGRLPVDAGK